MRRLRPLVLCLLLAWPVAAMAGEQTDQPPAEEPTSRPAASGAAAPFPGPVTPQARPKAARPQQVRQADAQTPAGRGQPDRQPQAQHPQNPQRPKSGRALYGDIIIHR